MLNSVEDYQRGTANSIAVLSNNLIGWMPAPFLYGLVSKLSNDPMSRAPLSVITYSVFLTATMMTIAIGGRLRREKVAENL